MFKGKQAIYFLLANNGGQRVTRIAPSITVCSSYPPTDLIAVTNEVVLDNSYSYPYTFTLMVTTMKSGDEGTGSFRVSVYSTDKRATLKRMA